MPDWSMTPPPVVPARFKIRLVVWAVPVTERTPVLVKDPKSMAPLAALVGAPRELCVMVVEIIGTPFRIVF